MPFEGERAGPGPLLRVSQNPRIQAAIDRMDIISAPAAVDLGEEVQSWSIVDVDAEDVSSIAYCVAFDGSVASVPILNGFPGAEAGIMTIAMVLIDLAAQRGLSASRPVDPVAYRRSMEAGSADCAFPGFNVTTPQSVDARHAFRRSVRSYLETETVMEDSEERQESLLETYRALLALRPQDGGSRVRCPYGDSCGQDPPGEFPIDSDGSCICADGREVLDIDALRLGESFRTEAPSFQAFGELMQVTERLALLNTIRKLVQPEAAGAITEVAAFFVDGPLAVHGHPAWLSQVIRQELRRLNQLCRDAGGRDLLILGIEKSGNFVDFLRRITVEMPHGRSLIRPGQALLIDNGFIRRNIVPGQKPYGLDTYFGRKLFYVNRAGAPLVVNVASYTDEHSDLSTAHADQFPRLRSICALLDETYSARYEGGVGPLIAAHAEASIPLRLGQRILGEMLRSRIVGRAQ